MTNRSFIRSQIHILVLFLVLLVQLAPWNTAIAQSSASEHLAVILILDNSGSMKTSDSSELRFTAARLFVALLDEGDSAGAILFSTESQPLTRGLVNIQGPTDKSSLVGSLKNISADGNTNVTAAFKDSQVMLENADLQGRRAVVVFLTDGMPTVPESEALEEAQKLGVPILSIAFTNQANPGFLNRLTNLTKGQIYPAEKATDLLDTYLQILGSLKDRTVLGFGTTSAPGKASLSLDPTLIPYVQQVSFIVAKPETVSADLQDPSNTQVTPDNPKVAFSMTEDPRFGVYTMIQPTGGEWSFQLDGVGTTQVRAILNSSLRARVTSPQGYVEANQPFPVIVQMLEEKPDGETIKIIGQAAFSALMTRPDGTQDSLDRFYDDGSNGDEKANDGDFTRLYGNANLPGIYSIQLTGSKGAIPVTFRSQFQAIQFPQIIVLEPNQAVINIHEKPTPIQIRLVYTDTVVLDSGAFIARILAPSTKTTDVPLKLNDGIYDSSFTPTENGVYVVTFEPLQAYYAGLPFKHTAQASFQAYIVPHIEIRDAQVVLEEPFASKKKIELKTTQTGLLITSSVSSTSSREEIITVHLEDMPGYKLLEADEQFEISPGQSLPINLHIQADAQNTAGPVNGKLVFTTQSNVDMVNAELPLQFTAFQPDINITANVISEVSSEACYRWSPVQLVLFINSTSLVTETIGLKLLALPEAELEEDVLQISPGQSTMQVKLQPIGKNFSWGSHQGNLVIESRRSQSDQLKLSPTEPIKIVFTIDPFWKSCKHQIISGAIILGVAIIGLWIGIKILLWLINRRLNE